MRANRILYFHGRLSTGLLCCTFFEIDCKKYWASLFPCNNRLPVNVDLLARQPLEGAIRLLKELLRLALLDNSAVIQNDDPVHVDDGAASEEESVASKRNSQSLRDSVSNDDEGARKSGSQSLLDCLIGCAV
jgi:hypothetical protein